MNDYNNVYQETAFPEGQMPEKKTAVYTTSERIAAILMLLFGFLWVRLCLYHASGVFTTLLYIAIITAQVIFLKKNGAVFTSSEKLTIGVMYVFSLVYTVTANGFLKGLNTVFLIMTGSLFLFHTANPDGDILRFLPVSLCKGMFAAPFRNFAAAPLSVTSGAKSKGLWKNIGYIVLGLLLAVPVTVVAGLLLCSADDNMSSLIVNLFRLPMEEVWKAAVHLLIGLFIGSMIFSAMYTAVHRGLTIVPSVCEESAKSCRIVPSPVIYAAVTPLCLLYLLFFFSQMQYFLGGFLGQTEGFTYAQYARRGFFELCAVCCINLAVIGCIGFFAARKTDSKPILLRIYASFLCVCSLLLAGTAIAKMVLYIKVYGMTQLRVYTTWFMLLLIVCFALLLVRQFREKLNIGKIGAAAFTVMFAFLCFSRPDAWMTRYNVEMYRAGQLEEFDSEVLLHEMSDDADAWSALTAYDSAELSELLDEEAKRRFDLYTEDPGQFYGKDFWDTTNLSAWKLMLYEN